MCSDETTTERKDGNSAKAATQERLSGNTRKGSTLEFDRELLLDMYREFKEGIPMELDQDLIEEHWETEELGERERWRVLANTVTEAQNV
jgi:hypothetical protein